MSAKIVPLPGIDPVVAPPPALAQARRIASAYQLLAAMAEDVGRVAAGERPAPIDKHRFSAQLGSFMDMVKLISGE